MGQGTQTRQNIAAQENKLQALGAAGDLYYGLRPETANAVLNMMQQGASLMGPAQSAMGQMYGPGAQLDMASAMQNPFSDRYYEMGRPAFSEQSSLPQNNPQFVYDDLKNNATFRGKKGKG